MTSTSHEKKISLTAGDNHAFDAFYYNTDHQNQAGIIILHEIFGMTPFIKNMRELWASKGCHVIAPALYDRYQKNIACSYDNAGFQQAIENKKHALDWDKQILDITAAKHYLQEIGCEKIGVIGFSWGGTLAWLSACRIDNIDCAVCYYGTHIYRFKNEIPRCPCLLHFAEKDELVPPFHVDAIREKHPNLQFELYPAEHGFRCDFWSDELKHIYDADASARSDQLTEKFLMQNL